MKLQPFGAYAANLLGLSEQVPAKVVFLTNGPAKKVKLGKLVIELRSTTPRHMATAGRAGGLVISALRYLGKAHITPERIARLRKVLSPKDRKRLMADLAHAPRACPVNLDIFCLARTRRARLGIEPLGQGETGASSSR